MATQARERLLQVAEDLFYREGLRAVGIDRVLAESGVGKASLYRHFASKDDLALAVLRRRDEAWRQWLRDAVEASGAPVAGRPLAVFDALAERFARRDFRGCAFINTMVEVADPDSPLHQAAAEHKRRVIGYLRTLLRDAGYRRSAALAEQLQILVDGAIVTAVREHHPAPARRARAVAAALLAGEAR